MGRRADTVVFVRYTQRVAFYFYAYDRLLASTPETQLQRAFIFLTEMFDWVDIRTNVGKMVSMVF